MVILCQTPVLTAVIKNKFSSSGFPEMGLYYFSEAKTANFVATFAFGIFLILTVEFQYIFVTS